MRIPVAKQRLCPIGSGESRPSLYAASDRFCAADRCMAWSWYHGHGQPYEQQVVWHDRIDADIRRFLAEPIENESDPEVAVLLSECHAKTRAYLLRCWNPPMPNGTGWHLHEKRWDEDNLNPYAIFRRERIDREGYCCLTGKDDLNSRDFG